MGAYQSIGRRERYKIRRTGEEEAEGGQAMRGREKTEAGGGKVAFAASEGRRGGRESLG